VAAPWSAVVAVVLAVVSAVSLVVGPVLCLMGGIDFLNFAFSGGENGFSLAKELLCSRDVNVVVAIKD
jgi:hypothetical protein